VSKSFANNEFDYQSIAVAPDGSAVTFTRWSPDFGEDRAWVPRVHALDLATGRERIFPAAEGTGQRGAAVFSPDGKLVAYARIFREGAFQLVVANADGSGGERPIGPRKPGPPDGSGLAASWAFTPDGTALVARYGGDADAAIQLLPLDGSQGSVVDAGSFESVDIQRLAP
jgi:Tol biopolymer transport system component